MHVDSPIPDTLDHRGSGTTSASVQQDPIVTVPFSSIHRVEDFRCSKSDRVSAFLSKEAPSLLVANYCRIFILPSPSDPAVVWGYYTLSAGILLKEQMSRSDERRVPLGLHAPVARIGFMGRDDRAEAGLGRGLLIDAARRIHRNPDIAAWGIILESENGPENKNLWDWYLRQGFKSCRALPNSLYAPLSALIPELQPTSRPGKIT